MKYFPGLKRVEIGDDCFKNVREFVLDRLDNLESVKIGKECFNISDKRRDDGLLRITNCPNLRQLEIGNESFRDYMKFELSNVNSLQSITFEGNCFWFGDCILRGE